MSTRLWRKLKIKNRAKYIGSKEFYIMTLSVMIPIMIQNGITNFVSLLDNIMVGVTGTDQMSGIAIVNQLIFVFNLCIFGGMSGAGIFTAQFYGKGDNDGVKYTFRFKMYIAVILTAVGLLVLSCKGDSLIRLYLHRDGGTGDIEATFRYARQYLNVIMIGLLPFAIGQAYAETLRETGETVVPMEAGIAAVIVKLTGNYILIYGKFGAPELGVVGAAVATVISRFVEVAIIVIWTHTHTQKSRFITGVYRSMRIPRELVWQIICRGAPLLVNETLWAAGMAALMQNYSQRGLSVIAALNISSTISNLFNIIFISMGSSIAIILGQQLGAGRTDTAKDYSVKLITFSILCCVVSGAVMAVLAPLFPRIYNTSESVRNIACGLIRIAAYCMPMYAFQNACYFTLRSGGRTFITFLFDSVFVWVFSIPLAYVLIHYTAMPILQLYTCCQLIELVKCVIGYVLVKKGIWIRNITAVQQG